MPSNVVSFTMYNPEANDDTFINWLCSLCLKSCPLKLYTAKCCNG